MWEPTSPKRASHLEQFMGATGVNKLRVRVTQCPLQYKLIGCHEINSMTLIRVDDMYNARFQITVLVRFGSVWFWLVTILLVVWPRSLLLCPYHKKLRTWWKKSFAFCQTDTPRFSCIMYYYRYRQLTSKNLEESEFSTIRKSTKRKSLVIRPWDFP